MKKRYLILCAAILAAGCQTEETMPEEDSIFRIEARSSAISSAVPSKTTLDAGSMSVVWENSDELSVVVANSRMQAYKFSKASGENAFYTEGYVPGAGTNEYFAIFPYDDSHDSYSESFVTGTVDIAAGPQTQAKVSDASHIDAPLYGYTSVTGSSEPVIDMHHLSALIKVLVRNDSGSEIVIRKISLNSEDVVLGGRFKVGGKEVSPETELAEDGVNSVSLTVTDGTLEAGKTGEFYLICAPFMLGEGDKLTVSVDFGNEVKNVVKTAPEGGWNFKAGTFNTTEIPVSDAGSEDEPLGGNVTAYPSIEGLATSQDFIVKANNKDIWVEDYNSSQAAFARFETDGPVRISVYTDAPAAGCKIYPANKNITVSGLGTEKLTFDITGPEKLYVEIPGLPELYIFADEPETEEDKAARNDPTYIYYGPGIHELEEKLVIESSAAKKNIYIDAGAIVKGCIEMKAAKATIKGRGILDASGKTGEAALKTHYASGTNVYDLLVRTSADMPVFLDNFSVYSTIRNVKIMGMGDNNIGLKMHVSRSVTFSDNFVRSSKDCIVINSSEKNYDVHSSFSNSSLWATSGSGIFFGMEGKGLLGNITVRNCDVIGAGGSSATGYGNAGITLCCDGPGPVKDILFEDVRIGDKISDSNLNVLVTDGRTYLTSGGQVGIPGEISGIIFRNVSWERPGMPMNFIGYSAENTISGISFTGCSVGGTPLVSTDAFTMNEFVQPTIFTFDL